MTREEIERLRDGWAATGWLSTDDAIALFDHAISEQSRIAALEAEIAKLREIDSSVVVRAALRHALWHLGTDDDRLQLSIPVLFRTNGQECAEMLRRALLQGQEHTP